MLTSRISGKGQVTIPKRVRESLHANPGDWIEYEVQGDTVVLRKARSFDRAFHSSVPDTLTEWSSPEDEETFRDL
jgi:antitoxin PrlF